MRANFVTVAVVALVSSSALILAGCGGDEPVTVTLRLDHRVNGTPLGDYVLDTPFTNEAGNAFGITRLVYFLSDLELGLDEVGATGKLPGAHLVDHLDADSRTLRLELPKRARGGTLRFVMGLPPSLNRTGAFPSPPQSQMVWPEELGGGYHHLKLEGRYLEGDGNPAPFKVHSGATGGGDHSFEVSLDVPELPQSGELVVVMNLERWFSGAHPWDLREKLPPPMHGMMGDAQRQRELQQNGATVFTLEVP